jgi:hypothetical protein
MDPNIPNVPKPDVEPTNLRDNLKQYTSLATLLAKSGDQSGEQSGAQSGAQSGQQSPYSAFYLTESLFFIGTFIAWLVLPRVFTRGLYATGFAPEIYVKPKPRAVVT